MGLGYGFAQTVAFHELCSDQFPPFSKYLLRNGRPARRAAPQAPQIVSADVRKVDDRHVDGRDALPDGATKEVDGLDDRFRVVTGEHHINGTHVKRHVHAVDHPGDVEKGEDGEDHILCGRPHPNGGAHGIVKQAVVGDHGAFREAGCSQVYLEEGQVFADVCLDGWGIRFVSLQQVEEFMGLRKHDFFILHGGVHGQHRLAGR